MRRRVIWVIVPLGWALSCGGRFDQTAAGDDDTAGVSSGQGGSAPARAGAPPQGGVVGKAGASNRAGSGAIGKAGSAAGGAYGTAGAYGAGGKAIGAGGKAIGGGVSTTGGFGQGGECACDPVACAPGYIEVPSPGSCCFHCEPDPLDCRTQRQRYLTMRTQMIEKYSTIGCSKNSDCTYYYEKNACGAQCGVPMALSVVQELSSYLDALAQMTCNAACPPSPTPPCDPIQPEPSCFKVWCE